MADATGTLIYEGEFNGFDASGFDINWTTNDAQGTLISYLIIKGGKWQAGQDTTKTSTGTKATTTDFQPQSLLTSNAFRTGTAWTGTRAHMALGLADGTTEAANVSADEDNLGTSVCTNWSSITKAQGEIATTVVLEEADLDSFNATDFTLDWTTASGVAIRFMWVVCADAAGAPPSRVTYQTMVNQSAMI
jgi:hypothetical protein